MVALVYLVAGISSRFGGAIKQFAAVRDDGKTLIEHSIQQAMKADFDRIVFIVGNLTEESFRKKFGTSYMGVPVFYALQRYEGKIRDRPWGTADALVTIKEHIDGPFVICNGDDIYGPDAFRTLVEHLKTSKESATVGYRLKETLSGSGTVNRGILTVQDGHYVQQIKETLDIDEKTASSESQDRLCSVNLFGFHQSFIALLEAAVTEFKRTTPVTDRTRECYLPEEVSKLISAGAVRVRLYEATERWQGITYQSDVAKLVLE